MAKIFGLHNSAIAMSLLLLIGAVSAEDMSEQSIVERIAPIGDIRLSTEVVTTKKQAAPATPRTAQTIYSTFCSVCHTTGIAGAPKLGDKAAWDARVAKGRDIINNHAIQGFNAMPARGTCADCSDEDIIKTIDYILSQ